MTVHVDLNKRKTASKKRTYEVAFTARDDQSFQQPIVRAKRIRMPVNDSMSESQAASGSQGNRSAQSESNAAPKESLLLSKTNTSQIVTGTIPTIAPKKPRPFNGHPN